MAKTNEYLKNPAFVEEILISKENDKLTRNAENMFVLLGNRAIKKMKYADPSDRDDCLQTGLLALFSNWRNFDPLKSNNAFAYFTEIFKRGMAQGWNSLKKKKGDPNNEIMCVSIQSSNEGDGIYNL